jgi:dienelactone hydrolase
LVQTIGQARKLMSESMLFSAVSFFLLAVSAANAAEYRQQEVRIPWVEAGAAGLDGLIVSAEFADDEIAKAKESGIDLPAKRPLVVMTHGTARDVEPRNHQTVWQLLPQAMWFARRGFVVLVVVRRGYGSSGGRPDYLDAGRCPQTDYERASQKAAEDLRTGINYGSRLPGVDATRVVAVGISTGGMATVALTADAPKNLVAAINFAGGRGSQADHDVCNPGSLVAAYHDFGKHSRVPMLWIYAENDKFFWPELAQQFDAAFRATGGRDEFIRAPVFGEDGHTLFNRGIDIWGPMVDGFLKEQNLVLFTEPLPAPKPPEIPPPAGLSEHGQAAFRDYLMLGPHKAFAMSAHHYAMSTAQMIADDARKKSLDSCNHLAEPSGEKCSVVFVENSPSK